jgi:uncharacterized phage protein (TIGR01671 family)
MREILFRGKTGCLWAYGHVRKLGNKTFMYEVDSYPSVFVDPDTIGQFTGLTDKNGKKIFEGDIIATPEYSWARAKKYIVSMDTDRRGWFPFARGDGCGCCEEETYDPNYCAVIGNVHDNTELMEDK